jgi:uncharacterized membrane protein YdbT with pleckstrin-like domain
MIELDTLYKPGRKTFMYLLFTYGWWLLLFGLGLIYLTYAMYFGNLNAQTVSFLAEHPTWYTDVGMLSQWTLIAGLGFLLVGYLRASVMYRKYKFLVDDHAFHMRTGLFRIREISAPYQQISNVHIDQPYHWRLFGLAEIEIIMASARTSSKEGETQQKFLIPCIDKSLAKELSHFLTRRAAGDTVEEIYADEYDENEEEDVLPQNSST